MLTGVALIQMFRRFDPAQFAWRQPPYEYEHDKLPIDILAGSDVLRQQIESDVPLDEIAESWRDDEARSGSCAAVSAVLEASLTDRSAEREGGVTSRSRDS